MLDLNLNVYAPFTVQYKLHTAHTKKFVNIHVQGMNAKLACMSIKYVIFSSNRSDPFKSVNPFSEASDTNTRFHIQKPFTFQAGVEESQQQLI